MERSASVLGGAAKGRGALGLHQHVPATRFTAAPAAWITLVRDRLHITYRVN